MKCTAYKMIQQTGKTFKKVKNILWHTYFDSQSKLSHVLIPRSPLQVTNIFGLHLHFLLKRNLNALDTSYKTAAKF